MGNLLLMHFSVKKLKFIWGTKKGQSTRCWTNESDIVASFIKKFQEFAGFIVGAGLNMLHFFWLRFKSAQSMLCYRKLP